MNTGHFPANAILSIGTCLPRGDVADLAAVNRNFTLPCGHACFWKRLWCVFTGTGGAPALVGRGHGISTCARHVHHVQQFRLTALVDRIFASGAPLPQWSRISSGLGIAAAAGNLQVLTVEGSIGVCADPIFGNDYELQRQAREGHKDFFGALAAAFGSTHGHCQLRRLKLRGGIFSAVSFERFLRAARPPLESLECKSALVHGENYPRIIAALRDSHPCPERFVHFATDEYIGGDDPFALLATSFPKLQVVRVPRMFGLRAFRPELLLELRREDCSFPQDHKRLRGGFKISSSGYISWFITSDHHDDDYRGQGLSWTEFENTSECMFSWKVGGGVTQEQILSFMRKCGIQHEPRLGEDLEVSDYEDEDDDDEP